MVIAFKTQYSLWVRNYGKCPSKSAEIAWSLNYRDTFISMRTSHGHASPFPGWCFFYSEVCSSLSIWAQWALMHPHSHPNHDILSLTFLSVTNSFSAAVRLLTSSSYLLVPKDTAVRLVLVCFPFFFFPFPTGFTQNTPFPGTIKKYFCLNWNDEPRWGCFSIN